MQWIMDHYGLVFGALWAISELLGAIPSVKSSGIFSLIVNILDSVRKLLPAAQPPAPPK